MMSLDTNQRVVTETSEVDLSAGHQRPLRVHQCLACCLWAPAGTIASDAPVWQRRCACRPFRWSRAQAAKAMLGGACSSGTHRRRASSHPPTSRAAPRCYSSCGRRTPPVKMCATCFTTSASSSSPKMASRFYHPPDASSIHGDAFFPEGWARASAATPEKGRGGGGGSQFRAHSSLQ